MFREAKDAKFHEEVAREHVDRGMPVIELHRNRGVPLSAVKKWIALYREGGRAALEKAAAEIARADAKPVPPKKIEELRAQLRTDDPDTVTKALITVARRGLVPLADDVLDVIAKNRGGRTIDAILTLKELRASDHLARAKKLAGKSCAHWF